MSRGWVGACSVGWVAVALLDLYKYLLGLVFSGFGICEGVGVGGDCEDVLGIVQSAKVL